MRNYNNIYARCIEHVDDAVINEIMLEHKKRRLTTTEALYILESLIRANKNGNLQKLLELSPFAATAKFYSEHLKQLASAHDTVNSISIIELIDKTKDAQDKTLYPNNKAMWLPLKYKTLPTELFTEIVESATEQITKSHPNEPELVCCYRYEILQLKYNEFYNFSKEVKSEVTDDQINEMFKEMTILSWVEKANFYARENVEPSKIDTNEVVAWSDGNSNAAYRIAETFEKIMKPLSDGLTMPVHLYSKKGSEMANSRQLEEGVTYEKSVFSIVPVLLDAEDEDISYSNARDDKEYVYNRLYLSAASQLYTRQTNGEINIYLSDGINPSHVFWNDELHVLKRDLGRAPNIKFFVPNEELKQKIIIVEQLNDKYKRILASDSPNKDELLDEIIDELDPLNNELNGMLIKDECWIEVDYHDIEFSNAALTVGKLKGVFNKWRDNTLTQKENRNLQDSDHKGVTRKHALEEPEVRKNKSMKK